MDPCSASDSGNGNGKEIMALGRNANLESLEMDMITGPLDAEVTQLCSQISNGEPRKKGGPMPAPYYSSAVLGVSIQTHFIHYLIDLPFLL